MADETTAPAVSQDQLAQIINQLLRPSTAQPATDPNAGASSREGRGFVSLLGEALGGGQQYGTTAQREQGGLAALAAAGARIGQASDWSYMPHSLVSIIGQGGEAARASLSQSQGVSAGLQHAAQQYAHEQQADQIARLKEALPYLQLLQNRDAIKGMPGSLLGNTPGANTSIGAAGNAGEYSVPAELLPIYAAASARTGVPVELLIAQHKQESGLNPAATGGAGEVGIGQVLPATARSPGYGMTGVDPASLRDPAANINFAANYLAARAKAAGADLRTPEGVAKALKAYNGGGDPNYVQNVLRYLPGAQKALAGGQPASAPGTPAPPAPVGQNPPPAAPGSPSARTPLPPPEAPMAGTAQVAGPAAPTAPVIPPQMPGTDATVAAIEEGMAGARAGATPGAIVTAQAGGQPTAPHPDSFEAYRLAHPIVPPPEQRALFDAGLTPEQTQAYKSQLRELELQYQIARSRSDPVAAAAVREKMVVLETATNTLRENARKLGIDKQADYFKEQNKQLFDAWTAEQAQRDKLVEVDRKLRADLTLKEKEGEISRLNTREGSFVESNKIIRDALAKESVSASGRVQALEGLRALSDNVADSNTKLQSLANVRYGGTTLLNHLANLGIVAKGDAGPIQMLQGGISGAIAELRSGMPMGSLSDRDLTFIESMGPSLYEDQATRSAVISYLQQAAKAKMRFATVYNEQMARPNANSAEALEKARDIMETKHPIVPQMPADIWANRANPDAAWQKRVIEWQTENNIKRHTLYRKPNGTLELVR